MTRRLPSSSRRYADANIQRQQFSPIVSRTQPLVHMDEMQQLDFVRGSWQPIRSSRSAGKVSQAEQDSFRGEKAPTLREALVSPGPQLAINVEIKD